MKKNNILFNFFDYLITKKAVPDFLKINGRSRCPNLRLLVLVAASVMGSSCVVNGQTTYTWTGTTNTAYGTSTNWSPSRTATANTDILRFNSGTTVTVTAVPTQTIGQLLVINSTTVDLQSSGGVTTTINGGTGTDLSVEGGSSLNVSGAASIQIYLATGTTASISGNMSFTSTTASTNNRLLAADANAITFNNGAVITQGTNSIGALFGNTAGSTPNIAIFSSGSTFIQAAGTAPFGLTAPDSRVVFQTGSLFKFQLASGNPVFLGRTYGNFEFNTSATSSPTGTSAVSMDNLTVTQGTLNFNVTGTPGHAIKGNISVASGAKLQFNPATAATINFNGTVAQSITNTSGGTLSFSANVSVVIDNASGVTFNQAQTFSGSVTVNSNALLATSAALTFSGVIAVHGKLQLNSGGSVSKAPTYSNTSTLVYNSASGYTVSAEWSTGVSTGAGVPNHVTVLQGTVILPSTARTIPSTLTMTSGALTLTNGGNLTVTTSLVLNDSKITTNTAKVIIPASGTLTRGTGYVVGNLQKNIATGSNIARTYEIGDASNYTPVSITFQNVSTQGDVTATVAAVAHPNFNNSTLNQTKYAQRYWTLTNASTAFDTYNATFTYVSGDLQGSASGGSLAVGRYASATWSYPTASNTGSTTTATGLSAFGDFMLAESNSCVSPTAFTVTGSGEYCADGIGVTIGLSNSETGVDYQLILSAANNGSPLLGTNSAISFGLKTVAGTYTVLGTRTTGGCSTTMTGNAVVTVNPRPTIAISNKVGDPCMLGVGAVTVTGSGGTGTLSITWAATANASRPVGATGSATGSPAGTAQTSPVTYTGLTGWYDYNFLVTDSKGCTAPSIGNQ